jgi:hypothetical protein
MGGPGDRSSSGLEHGLEASYARMEKTLELSWQPGNREPGRETIAGA